MSGKLKYIFLKNCKH